MVATAPEANVMVSGHGAWESSLCWASGKVLLIPFMPVPQAPLLLVMTSSQVQLPAFSQQTCSLWSHQAITPNPRLTHHLQWLPCDLSLALPVPWL